MESRKRLCMESMDENMQAAGSSLMTLNDDCILKIFKYLDINQLCVVAGTCKKFYQLVDMFFHQRFRNKIMSEVRIQISFDRQIILLPKERYIIHFLQFMRNVRLCEGFVLRPSDMAVFLRKNFCDKNLKIISFELINFNSLHGSLLLDWLSTVEGLAFFGCKYLHQILKYCGSLKYLKIDRYTKDQANQWMEQICPTLEHLQYEISCKQKLITFLTCNRTVKSLMLKLDVTTPQINRNLFDKLQHLNLEELMLSFEHIDVLPCVLKQLKAICNRSHFKRLEICVNNTSWPSANFYEMFSSLRELVHLHGLHLLQCDNVFSLYITLEHLKILQVTYVAENISTDSLSKNLPNLEELYLMSLSANFQDLITPFARNAGKLKKIVSRDFKIANRMEMINVRLANCFNDQRVQLTNACKLFIYIGKDEFDETLDATTPKFSLVEIRPVEFQLKDVDFIRSGSSFCSDSGGYQ